MVIQQNKLILTILFGGNSFSHPGYNAEKIKEVNVNFMSEYGSPKMKDYAKKIKHLESTKYYIDRFNATTGR